MAGMDSKTVIDRLGGVQRVAEICEVLPAAVYQWYGVYTDKNRRGRTRSIPRARLVFLRKVYPEAFIEEPKPKRAKAKASVG